MQKPWGGGGGGIGAWAAEAEREEEEQRAASAAAAASAVDSQSFPSLKEAANAKPKKKKMSLAEFYSASGARETERTGLTPDEMLMIPTGPRQRSQEEMQYGRLGGGFSSYNSGAASSRTMRDRGDGDGSWGGGGGRRSNYGEGFDDERRGQPRRVSDFDQPSRADEVDNWAKAKTSLPSFDQRRQNRYGGPGGDGGGGGGGGGDFGAISRADEADNWTNLKKPLPTRSSTFGSSFSSSRPEADRWTRGDVPAGGGRGGGGGERPRLVLDPPKRSSGGNEPPPVADTNKSNPFGAARPREEVLAEKGLDWKKVDLEIDAKKVSRPTSAQSSRPSSAQSGRSEGLGMLGMENVAKPRPKANPFGDAKPREVLLEERGQDWRKIDLELEHRRVERPETDEERLLKEEIANLKKELDKGSEGSTNSDQPNFRDIIHQKERDLEKLICDLDDKVRFTSKPAERPGSDAGRAASFSENSHSRSGSIDESRSVEPIDRPRSRGMAEDRRSFKGSRQRGFIDNKDVDRPNSRERW